MIIVELLKNDLVETLLKMKTTYDLSDIGNEIGIVIGKYINKEIGDKNDFINGVKHGISLIDGTHDKPSVRPDLYVDGKLVMCTGKLGDKPCDRPAVGDYNGHGDYGCQLHLDVWNREFDDEYR
jgi:hypothetical protein